MTKQIRLFFFVFAYLVCTPACRGTGTDKPLDVLRAQAPALYKLYQQYPDYHPALSDYAKQQNFRRPFENLATVVHELIHIDSVVHQGYFIDGVYYEPYVAADAWPALRNQDVMPFMLASERGLIYTKYMKSTPNNNLGNILDEVNAYGHVLKFVCTNEAVSTQQQAENLLGHLHVVEAYLRVLRTMQPAQYSALVQSRHSSGALSTITGRAWNALITCGLPAGQLPKQEASHFLRLLSGIHR